MRFQKLLTRNNLQEKLFDQVVEQLAQRGQILKKDTIVDSTFIESPSSIRNQKKEQDPEAHSANKGNTWPFGYKDRRRQREQPGLYGKGDCSSYP